MEGHLHLSEKTRQDCAIWLKSLRPQKQKWDEEDIVMYNDCICAINAANEFDYSVKEKEKLTNWLRNIRPQKQWKPTKEQIMALRWILNNIPYDTHKEEISGLLEQILKL